MIESERVVWFVRVAILVVLSTGACVQTVSAQAAEPGCEVTLPNGQRASDAGLGTGGNHGNGELFVGIPGGGLFPYGPREDHYSGVMLLRGFLEGDGSVVGRDAWWREVPGALEVEGRRLDAEAPPLEATVPDGYGETGLQMVGLRFPTPGCWEITGRVGDASLTYVTLVEHWRDAPAR